MVAWMHVHHSQRRPVKPRLHGDNPGRLAERPENLLHHLSIAQYLATGEIVRLRLGQGFAQNLGTGPGQIGCMQRLSQTRGGFNNRKKSELGNETHYMSNILVMYPIINKRRPKQCPTESKASRGGCKRPFCPALSRYCGTFVWSVGIRFCKYTGGTDCKHSPQRIQVATME